jgi:hypothetical protein
VADSAAPPGPGARVPEPATVPVEGAISRIQSTSRGLGVVTILIGATVLTGWAAGWPLVTTILPGVAAMKANTALAFVPSGTALTLLARPSGPRARGLGRAAVGLVILVSATTLLEHVTG